MDKKLFCAVDVGGTKILAAIVDSKGHVLARKKMPTPQKATSAKVYDQIYLTIKQLFEENKIETKRVLGIGMGIPGIVLPNNVDILRTPNIKLAGYPLAKKLSKDLNVKVILGNDVNLGLLGEQWQGAGIEHNNIVGLFPGTGVGGAIIINGQLLMGTQGAAGELGHIIINQDSDAESAGLYGSLEALASRRAVEKKIRLGIKSGESTVVTELLDKKLDVIKSKIIAKALVAKDPLVTQIINDMCRSLANACLSLRHTLNPELFILGGGVIEACGDYILPRVKRRFNSSPFMKGIDSCKIVQSELGDDAVLLGAVALLRMEFKKKRPFEIYDYPDINLSRGRKVIVDDEVIVGDFLVKSDGKVKKIKNEKLYSNYLNKNQLDLNVIESICKKKAEILIVAKRNRKISMTREARNFLDERNIMYKSLAVAEALRLYSKTNIRKVLLVAQ